MESTVLEAVKALAEGAESIEAAYAMYLEPFNTANSVSEQERIAAQIAALAKQERTVVQAQIAGISAGTDPTQYDAVFAEMRDKRLALLKAQEQYAGAQTNTAGRDIKSEARAFADRAGAVVAEVLNAPELTAAEKHDLLGRIIKRIQPTLESDTPGLRIELHGSDDLTVNVMQMALAVGEALASVAPPYLARTVEKPLRDAFVHWLVSPDNTRAPGMTCLRACRNLQKGLPWMGATVAESKGCGANMRVAPVGLLPGVSETERAGLAQFQAALTHGHPTGLAASDLTAQTVAWLRAGESPANLPARLRAYAEKERTTYHADYLGDLYERIGEKSGEAFIARGWDECLGVLSRLEAAVKNGDRKSDPCLATGEGWVAEEAFATGLLCFLLFPNEPVAALRRASVTSGDSDSLACLAGAFVGAYHGLSAWPADWLANIEYRDRLARLGDLWD